MPRCCCSGGSSWSACGSPPASPVRHGVRTGAQQPHAETFSEVFWMWVGREGCVRGVARGLLSSLPACSSAPLTYVGSCVARCFQPLSSVSLAEKERVTFGKQRGLLRGGRVLLAWIHGAQRTKFFTWGRTWACLWHGVTCAAAMDTLGWGQDAFLRVPASLCASRASCHLAFLSARWRWHLKGAAVWLLPGHSAASQGRAAGSWHPERGTARVVSRGCEWDDRFIFLPQDLNTRELVMSMM